MPPIFPIGRKAKDLRDLKNANASGGSVVIRSKNKIVNPSNPSQTLGRGSTVTIAKKPVVTMDKPTVTPGAKHTTVKKETTERYVPGDFQKQVHDRPTKGNEGVFKAMGESPKKTAQRDVAQSQKKVDYTTDSGKKEYSGRIAKSTTYTPTTTKDPDKVEQGKMRVAMKKTVDVKPVAPAQSKKTGSSGGRSGLIIHRSAGTNNQGRPQNYKSLELGGKKLVKVRAYTPRTKRK